MKFVFVAILFTFLIAASLQLEGCGATDASGKWTSCYFRYVLINGACVAVNAQCKTWSSTTAECTGCYDGWILSSGKCITGGNSDPNCV